MWGIPSKSSESFAVLCPANMLVIKQRSLQENHVLQYNASFYDRMVVVVGEEIRNYARFSESARMIEGKSQMTGTGSHAQARVILISFGNEFDHGFAISFALKIRYYGKVFNFQGSVSNVGNDADSLYTIVIQSLQFTVFQITVNHILLFVCKEKKLEESFLIFLYESKYSHSGNSVF